MDKKLIVHGLLLTILTMHAALHSAGTYIIPLYSHLNQNKQLIMSTLLNNSQKSPYYGAQTLSIAKATQQLNHLFDSTHFYNITDTLLVTNPSDSTTVIFYVLSLNNQIGIVPLDKNDTWHEVRDTVLQNILTLVGENNTQKVIDFLLQNNFDPNLLPAPPATGQQTAESVTETIIPTYVIPLWHDEISNTIKTIVDSNDELPQPTQYPQSAGLALHLPSLAKMLNPAPELDHINKEANYSNRSPDKQILVVKLQPSQVPWNAQLPFKAVDVDKSIIDKILQLFGDDLKNIKTTLTQYGVDPNLLPAPPATGQQTAAPAGDAPQFYIFAIAAKKDIADTQVPGEWQMVTQFDSSLGKYQYIASGYPLENEQEVKKWINQSMLKTGAIGKVIQLELISTPRKFCWVVQLMSNNELITLQDRDKQNLMPAWVDFTTVRGGVYQEIFDTGHYQDSEGLIKDLFGQTYIIPIITQGNNAPKIITDKNGDFISYPGLLSQDEGAKKINDFMQLAQGKTHNELMLTNKLYNNHVILMQLTIPETGPLENLVQARQGYAIKDLDVANLEQKITKNMKVMELPSTLQATNYIKPILQKTQPPKPTGTGKKPSGSTPSTANVGAALQQLTQALNTLSTAIH